MTVPFLYCQTKPEPDKMLWPAQTKESRGNAPSAYGSKADRIKLS